MRAQFNKLPKIIQNQIIIRIAAGIVFFVLFFIILICFLDKYFYLPCLLFSAFLLVNGGVLFYNCVSGNYISIEGVCESVEKFGIRRRIRSISIRVDNNKVKIPIRQRMKSLSVGDTVIAYVSDKTPVYEHDAGYMICSYYALEIKKE